MLIRRKPHIVPGLNTTSTADISFMLLIFFLVTTSMDVDKGLLRQLPPADNKEQVDETLVNRKHLMKLELTADNRLLKDGGPITLEQLQPMVIKLVSQYGNKHLISIDSAPEARYELYFSVQNELAAAYRKVRDGFSRQRFGKSFGRLSVSQKDSVLQRYPQRIAENYDFTRGGQP